MYQGLYSKCDHRDKMIPIIIPRSEHPISRKMIDEEALKVLYRLHRHGFISYLVGGSVRDLLLGKVPKDFDVATNANLHEINVLFKNSRTIGRRFRLVQVFFKGGKVIEVSTFRSHSEFEETKGRRRGQHDRSFWNTGGRCPATGHHDQWAVLQHFRFLHHRLRRRNRRHQTKDHPNHWRS